MGVAWLTKKNMIVMILQLHVTNVNFVLLVGNFVVRKHLRGPGLQEALYLHGRGEGKEKRRQGGEKREKEKERRKREEREEGEGGEEGKEKRGEKKKRQGRGRGGSCLNLSRALYSSLSRGRFSVCGISCNMTLY